MTREAPSFDIVWSRIKDFISNYPLAAHNAGFDSGVLKAMLLKYSICWDFPQTLCSLKIAREAWPQLHSHGLKHVSKYLGIKLNHHNALSDAEACAQIILKAEKIKNNKD